MATVFTRQDEKIAALESTQETPADNQLIQLWLIHELREAAKKDAQPLQMDRADILRALIAANGGKMLLSSARQKMHLRKDQFSQMLKGCNFVEVKPLHSDKRKMVIILKNELFFFCMVFSGKSKPLLPPQSLATSYSRSWTGVRLSFGTKSSLRE